MKIRLFGDSLRLRLTQAEVATLAHGGSLETVIPFPGEALACMVQPSDEPLTARHAAGRITILMPRSETTAWAASETEGMYGASGHLRLAVEKDYNCLHKTDSPENDGTFPNPLGA